MRIVSFNLNSWCSTVPLTQKQKIEELAQYISHKYNEPEIIALQEVIAGQNEKHLKTIQEFFPNYSIITPAGFDHLTHFKSLICVTLVKNSIAYKVLEFPCCLPNRVSYVRIFNNRFLPQLTIMNCYMVQTAIHGHKPNWYVNKRIELREKLFDEVINAVNNTTEQPLILAGDFQENLDGEHTKRLGAICEAAETIPFRKNWNAEGIDHFFLNSQAWSNFLPLSIEYDKKPLKWLSDHGIITLETI
ncbi:endonuclease/exonuclease/phosphatase family protein [Ruminococcus sp. FC2018]|uniref:endonuclease/exonuclease/phosphatase family protein n=1 Tax=Ruminococcus sp. FC2018 TaxID=1410617 RepID=UPI000491AEC2|nr:endonuclease/exonuclease/phosphatase family protein [Ruminococcus sp. FC2018]